MDARTGRRQKRISRMQEKRVAAALGGKTQANSGATRLGGGGDVRVIGETRVECKFTEASSFSLKLTELKKLQKEAISALEEPVFNFEFRTTHGHVYQSYAVVRGYGPGDTHKTTPSKRMNLHETDLGNWFLRDAKPLMRVCFFDRQKQAHYTYDIIPWDLYVQKREEADA